MKKALLFVDYNLNIINSVVEIQRRLSEELQRKGFQVVIASVNGYNHEWCLFDTVYGFMTIDTKNESIISIVNSRKYKTKEIIRFAFSKVAMLIKKTSLLVLNRKHDISKLYIRSNLKYHEHVINITNPDVIIYFTYLPNIDYIKICNNRELPYIHILYDTYISRPGLDIKEAFMKEKNIIESSQAYFIPSFFLEEYIRSYRNQKCFAKIKRYELPLLIEQEKVERAYKAISNSNIISFAYFGQLQSFRNACIIDELFTTLGIKVDVFSNSKIESKKSFIQHNPVSDDELWETVARSKVLVIFDNSIPYQDYLPSKCYLYVSFTKPILAIGDNDACAVKRFFANYPMFYYHKIGEPLDGLLDFIHRKYPLCFLKELYIQFDKYLPDKALESIVCEVNSLQDTGVNDISSIN